MTPEDYVSYPIAIKLKAAGFNEPCGKSVKIIPGTEREEWDEEECQWCTVQDIEYYPKITLWQAQKWLRDVFLLHVCANPAIPTRKWQFYIDDLNQQINPYDGELMTRWDDDMQEMADKHFYDSYEQALSAGITSALELIEKKGE